MRRALAAGCLIAVAIAPPALSPAFAQTARVDERAGAALDRAQGAIGDAVPGALTFTRTDGKPIRIADFAGKPLLVSLVYTGCIDACPAIIDNLYPAIEIGQDALGTDSFAAITVGFDARNDTPARMLSFARSRGADLPNWHFLSGDQATIDRLADAVGFTIEAGSAGFDHMAQISILGGNGRIYRHVYGGAFAPPAVVEPLKELVFGRQRPVTSIDGLIDRVKLFCTTYSAATGRYTFDYSIFIGLVIGMASLGVVAAWLVREFRRSRA